MRGLDEKARAGGRTSRDGGESGHGWWVSKTLETATLGTSAVCFSCKNEWNMREKERERARERDRSNSRNLRACLVKLFLQGDLCFFFFFICDGPTPVDCRRFQNTRPISCRVFEEADFDHTTSLPSLTNFLPKNEK